MKLNLKKRQKTLSFIFVIFAILYFFTPQAFADYWGSMDQLTPGASAIFTGINQQIKFDLQLYNNKPKIVFQNNSGSGWGNIYYTEWSGSAWTKADGTPGYDLLKVNTNNHDEPILRLDSVGRPHVIFRDNALNKIIYRRWSGTAWVSVDGLATYDAVGMDSIVLDFALDSNDKPHIVWRKDSPFQVYYIKWSTALGAWTNADDETLGPEKVTNFVGNNALIVHLHLYNNQPYLVFDGILSGIAQVFFTRWSPGLSSWVYADGQTTGLENVSQSTTGANRPNFAVDSQGNIKIAWYELVSGKNDIFYSQWTVSAQAWTRVDGTTSGKENLTNTSSEDEYTIGSVGRNNFLKLDRLGNPRVLFAHITTTGVSQLGFTEYTPGVGWTQADGITVSPLYNNLSDDLGLTANSYNPVLALDGSGLPRILWSDDVLGYKDVFYTQWTVGSGWTKTDLTPGYDNLSNSAAGDVNYQVALAVNSVNNPVVVFVDNKSGTSYGYFTAWSQADQGQVNISASVDSTLSINIPQASCLLGDFDVYKLKTCSYRLVVNTNATAGYVAYVRASGSFGSSVHDLADTPNSKVQAQTESYGVATTKAGEDMVLINDANGDFSQNENDCAFLNNQDNSVWLTASVLTTDPQSFASSSGPVDNDITYLCHGVSISGVTPSGTYQQTSIITVVNHF